MVLKLVKDTLYIPVHSHLSNSTVNVAINSSQNKHMMRLDGEHYCLCNTAEQFFSC